MPDATTLLETQAAATRQIVQSLSEADLAKQCPSCPGWTLKDVVAHLTTGAQMFDLIARGALDGANWMPERQRRLAENAALSDAALRARYAEADQALVATFKGLSPEQRQAKRQHPAFGEVPAERFLFMRISETAVHGWDLRAAADPTARLDAPATAEVVRAIIGVYPEWFLPEKISSLQRVYGFVVGDQRHTLKLANGKAAWTDSEATPDATLTLDAADFLLLMTGRLSGEQLVASGRAQASGDVEAARQLSTLFKAYGGR